MGGLSDPDWYPFPSNCRRTDEVNSWQRHANMVFHAIKSEHLQTAVLLEGNRTNANYNRGQST